MVLEVDSTEDVLNALLEYLVDPRLPFKSSVLKKAPTLSQQQSVATQTLKEEACSLLYSSVTEEVWSLIEKGLELSSAEIEGLSSEKRPDTAKQI
ncbi:hypothetical protein BC332_18583 [Capsicum chinense]|nr:hypothetical protein BC332_18583 [Capsicum chinense]